MLFSDHNRSLQRRQPAAMTKRNSPSQKLTCWPGASLSREASCKRIKPAPAVCRTSRTPICKARTDTPAEMRLKPGPSLRLQQLQCFWTHFQLCWLLPLQPHVPSFALTRPSAYIAYDVATVKIQFPSCLLTMVINHGNRCSHSGLSHSHLTKSQR